MTLSPNFKLLAILWAILVTSIHRGPRQLIRFIRLHVLKNYFTLIEFKNAQLKGRSLGMSVWRVWP